LSPLFLNLSHFPNSDRTEVTTITAWNPFIKEVLYTDRTVAMIARGFRTLFAVEMSWCSCSRRWQLAGGNRIGTLPTLSLLFGDFLILTFGSEAILIIFCFFFFVEWNGNSVDKQKISLLYCFQIYTDINTIFFIVYFYIILKQKKVWWCFLLWQLSIKTEIKNYF